MIAEPKKKTALARNISKIVVGNRLRNLDEAKVLSFMDSIKRDGLKTPITVFGKEDDATVRLSAGGHRLEACSRLGMSTILCFHELGDETDCELWEIDENLIRSDLSVSERALFMARRKELHLVKYPETAHGGDRRSSGKVCHLKTDNPQSFTAATANATGQSERTIRLDVERGERISRSAMQMLVGTTHDKGVTLDHLKRLDTAQSQELYVRELIAADKVADSENKLRRTAKLKQNRVSRLNLISAIAEQGRRNSMEMPRAAYAVGYADPAWMQEAWSEETGQDKGLKYPSMSLDAIKALCAGDNSPFTRDSRLYLWTTSNRMKMGIEVLEAWGFEFCTVWTWDKEDMGMGFELRDQTEHLLIGKRGNFPAPTPGEQPRSLYREKKGPHSRKPVHFANEIERLWPTMRKLELFQRKDSLAEGDIRLNGMWDFWGNQAGSPESEAA